MDICRFVDEKDRLYRHMTNMAESAGTSLQTGRGLYTRASCAEYYFTCLLKEGLLAELMSLPDFLKDPLSKWLAEQVASFPCRLSVCMHPVTFPSHDAFFATFVVLPVTFPLLSSCLLFSVPFVVLFSPFLFFFLVSSFLFSSFLVLSYSIHVTFFLALLGFVSSCPSEDHKSVSVAVAESVLFLWLAFPTLLCSALLCVYVRDPRVSPFAIKSRGPVP